MSYSIYGQNINFIFRNLEAGPPNRNWMFQFDDTNFWMHDGSPYTTNLIVPDIDNFAYEKFTWSEHGAVNHPSSSEFVSKTDLPHVSGADLKLRLENFSLFSFHHINTVDPEDPWDTFGQAGDERVYVNGTGTILDGEEVKLIVKNCRLSVTVPYPTANQLEPALHGFVLAHDVGTGITITGNGKGNIDVDNSDPNWLLDLGVGQISFDFTTINEVIQDYWGYYDFNINAYPADFQEIIGFFEFAASKGIPETKTISGATFAFNGEPTLDNGDLRRIYANKIIKDPGTNGSLPSGINNISTQHYWQIGTTFKTYDVDLTFDIADLTGVSDYNTLTVLHRVNSSAPWKECTSVSVNSINKTITAPGLQSFSEFVVASKSTNNPLPVELVSFEAESSNAGVLLTWNTATEINNYGFEIERKLNSNTNWSKIGFVQGNGNSSSNKYYSYIDKEQLHGTYSYRLKQIDNNGEYEYSSIIEVNVNSLPKEYVLNQNYPNPFNPSTTISFSIPEKQFVSLKIYDILGNEITTIVNEELEAGSYNKLWNSASFNGKVASGIYFYKLTAGSFVETKKMSLMK